MTPGVVSYWCQTAPVPSVLIKEPLKNTIVGGFSDSPDSVTPGHCILRLIAPAGLSDPLAISVCMCHKSSWYTVPYPTVTK